LAWREGRTSVMVRSTERKEKDLLGDMGDDSFKGGVIDDREATE